MDKALSGSVIQQINDMFAGLKEPVEILFFGSKAGCEYCTETQQLLEEVISLNSNLTLKVYDIQENQQVALQFNVAIAPSIVIAAKVGSEVRDLGIKFLGIPAGHEFGTLVNDILMVSRRESGLKEQTREFLKKLEKPLQLQVFVTPSCPYCPRAVLLAHQMAMENPQMIHAEGIDAMEFPELANRFNVHGVPQTVINSGAGIVVGSAPERNLVAEIKQALLN